jgi:hypothetical protein
MEEREHQDPDPFRRGGRRICHPEKQIPSLRVDVMEWYYPTLLSRREKSSRKGWPCACNSSPVIGRIRDYNMLLRAIYAEQLR